MTARRQIVRLRITLDDVEPKVERIVVVPLAIRLDRLHQTLQAAMGWSDKLENATFAMTDKLKELRAPGDTLLRLTENESELVRLEERLAQNLDSVRVVDTLEETLLNLNAAVNLMTARVKGKAA